MKAINLLTVTIIAGAIALPIVTYAETTIQSQQGVGVGVKNTTTTGDLGIGVDAGAGAQGGAKISPSFDRPDRHGPKASADGSNNVNENGVDNDPGPAVSASPGAGGGVATSSDFGIYDRNGDGVISRSEFTANSVLSAADNVFTDLDRNNDGRLSQDEFDLFARSTNDASGGVRAAR